MKTPTERRALMLAMASAEKQGPRGFVTAFATAIGCHLVMRDLLIGGSHGPVVRRKLRNVKVLDDGFGFSGSADLEDVWNVLGPKLTGLVLGNGGHFIAQATARSWLHLGEDDAVKFLDQEAPDACAAAVQAATYQGIGLLDWVEPNSLAPRQMREQFRDDLYSDHDLVLKNTLDHFKITLEALAPGIAEKPLALDVVYRHMVRSYRQLRLRWIIRAMHHAIHQQRPNADLAIERDNLVLFIVISHLIDVGAEFPHPGTSEALDLFESSWFEFAFAALRDSCIDGTRVARKILRRCDACLWAAVEEKDPTWEPLRKRAKDISLAIRGYSETIQEDFLLSEPDVESRLFFIIDNPNTRLESGFFE